MADNSGGTVRIVFHPLNRVVTVPVNSTVLEAIRVAEIQFESICGGKGECNKCKVIFISGSCDAGTPGSVKGLLPEEVAHDYCRACQTHVKGDSVFIIPVESRIDAPKILEQYGTMDGRLSPAAVKYLLYPVKIQDSPRSHRSLRLEGYSGTRPHMTKLQYDRLGSVSGPVTVTITSTSGYPEVIGIEEGDTRRDNYGIAIDLGTTTVVGVLINLFDGTVCAQASTLNRQITYGEELISRIAYARDPDGATKIQAAAVESINEVIGVLTREKNISPLSVNEVCIAGNTVMEYLLVGQDTRSLEMANAGIGHAPFTMKACNAGIIVSPDAWLYCLPNVSRFVGGDAVGDIVASGMHRSPEISLLIDLGTNGEVILGNNDWLACVSCASGPAFEGAGISSGMRAMRGAIDHVFIDPDSRKISWTTIENEPPRGICGSGIIDAAAAMVTLGVLDFTGKIVEGKPGVRPGTAGPEYVLVPFEKTATGRDIVITREDMAYLVDSKAAACGAVGVLLKKYRIPVKDIRHVFLAGAFGAYADRKSIVQFGIIPDFYCAEFHAMGNGSLSGACAALLSKEIRGEMQAIAEKMVYIDLLVDADFIDEYSSATYIPGKKEYFLQRTQ